MSAIHAKLAKILGEIGPINKDSQNREQGFAFRSIEQITAAARPLFAREGISTAPRMISHEHSEVTAKSGAKGFRAIVEVAYTFTAAEDDSSIELSMLGEAVDYGDKSTSKAVQMAYKYALTQALLIGSGEADPDSQSVDVGHVEAPRGRRRGKPEEPAETSIPADVQAFAREAARQFTDWTDQEKADAFKHHTTELLGAKPTTIPEVQRVIEAMADSYYKQYPDKAPF